MRRRARRHFADPAATPARPVRTTGSRHDYWFEGAIGRGYVLGSDMFAAIYLALGRKAVFAVIEDPRRLFQLYDRALDKDPQRLGRCVRVPDTAVAQALAIGHRGATR